MPIAAAITLDADIIFRYALIYAMMRHAYALCHLHAAIITMLIFFIIDAMP